MSGRWVGAPIDVDIRDVFQTLLAGLLNAGKAGGSHHGGACQAAAI